MTITHGKRPETNATYVTVEASDVELVSMGRAIVGQMVERASSQLCADLLKERGQELLAKVDLQAVLNQAVAKTVLAIAEAQAKAGMPR